MAEQSGEPSQSRASGDFLAEDSLLAELMQMISAFWASRERNKLLMLAAALVVIVGATAYGQIRLNAWNRPFYNALTNKDIGAFMQQLLVFAELAGILLVLNVAQMWLNQTSKVVLRQGLVHDLLNEWLVPSRAFRLSYLRGMGSNPDQRLHADAQHLTELTTDLGIGLLQSTLLLASFIGVLWVLSDDITLSFAGHSFHPPGYMVWCALFYAGTASFFGWRVGRPLISLNAERYAREAELRFALVHVNEELEAITIYGGEADEKAYINGIFKTVLEISRRLVGAVTRLTWITAGYGWFTLVAPILVAAPGYFFGNMTFGELMMVVGAFNQVQQSLRWFVDNFSTIADWRATLLRVAGFRRALLAMDKLGHAASRIELEETDDQSIHFDDLKIAAPTGCIMLSETHLELNPGERILIEGERGAGKTLLFRAIVGLWPWGSGSITRPARRVMMFMSARAYIPPGTLRTAATYPHSADVYKDADITEAFTGVGLERLLPMLDQADRWDRRLNDDEKQRLVFARVILQKPRWVVLDGALDVLDPLSRQRIEAIFKSPLADVGLINISHDASGKAFYTRTLRVVRDPHGQIFRPVDGSEIIDQPEPAKEAASAK
jgi:putative ATP-binding cassette transporter